MPSAEFLANYRGAGYVVAPAGFGKTHLIAESVSHSEKRQLVLTHTYAGVNALRQKLRQLHVPSQLYQLDTVASWALRLCLSYRQRSGWTAERPVGQQWEALYARCAQLLQCEFAGRVLVASYDGVFVDEYQDCTVGQHRLVKKLASMLPCRVFGDRLQGIFDFGNPIDWDHDVVRDFESLGTLATPHRWNRAGRPRLGEWLIGVRASLERREPIHLRTDPEIGLKVAVVSDAMLLQRQAATCRYFHCERVESVAAIHKGDNEYKEKCHHLAKQTGGRFTSIEEIEGKALFAFIARMRGANTASDQLLRLIALASSCMTGVNEALPAATRRGEVTAIRAKTKNRSVAVAANAFLEAPSPSLMLGVLLALRAMEGVNCGRGDLFNRIIGVLRKQSQQPELSLEEAANEFQGEFRHRGRPVGRRLIGTTLLLKGLEFDHGIVLDAGSLSAKDLYVALTRGSKSITVVTTAASLNPTP